MGCVLQVREGSQELLGPGMERAAPAVWNYLACFSEGWPQKSLN